MFPNRQVPLVRSHCFDLYFPHFLRCVLLVFPTSTALNWNMKDLKSNLPSPRFWALCAACALPQLFSRCLFRVRCTARSKPLFLPGAHTPVQVKAAHTAPVIVRGCFLHVVSLRCLSNVSWWGSGLHGAEGHGGTLSWGAHSMPGSVYIHPLSQVLLFPPAVGEEGQVEGTWLRGGRTGVPGR